MKFTLVYARSGMGRIMFVNQSQPLTLEQLQDKVDKVIPRELQLARQHLQDMGQTAWIRTWVSQDPESKAMVIAIDV